MRWRWTEWVSIFRCNLSRLLLICTLSVLHRGVMSWHLEIRCTLLALFIVLSSGSHRCQYLYSLHTHMKFAGRGGTKPEPGGYVYSGKNEAVYLVNCDGGCLSGTSEQISICLFPFDRDLTHAVIVPPRVSFSLRRSQKHYCPPWSSLTIR